MLGTLYRCGGLWLGFTLAKRRAKAGWFYKWPLSLWKDSSSFFTLMWDQNSSSVHRWTRWWVALLRCGCMIWSIEGGGGWPFWKELESLGGGGFHVILWFTCRIGGGALWWVCKGIGFIKSFHCLTWALLQDALLVRMISLMLLLHLWWFYECYS